MSGLRPFSLCILVSDKRTYTWCNVSCNVWLCMNEMSEHLNLFFVWICFIFLFRIHFFSCPCALHGLAILTAMLLSPFFGKAFFALMPSYSIIISLCSKSNTVILWLLHGRKTHLTFSHFFVLVFSLHFRVVNKFRMNNENLPKQYTYSIHVNKIKCTLHPKR